MKRMIFLRFGRKFFAVEEFEFVGGFLKFSDFICFGQEKAIFPFSERKVLHVKKMYVRFSVCLSRLKSKKLTNNSK